jgi:hypothetical protein
MPFQIYVHMEFPTYEETLSGHSMSRKSFVLCSFHITLVHVPTTLSYFVRITIPPIGESSNAMLLGNELLFERERRTF